ncbi:hypothetical protein BGX23_003421 [Mortierella sp. AD031]|nr:hypothetical protein BGX23_003421 [Mortierella sp. AD031]
MTGTPSVSNQQQEASRVFLIVELLEHIGSHLTPPDLLSCVQVSQHWNLVLIPVLWHTIDDSLYSWSGILSVYPNDKATRLKRFMEAAQTKVSNCNNNSNSNSANRDERGGAIIDWPARRAETVQWLYTIFKKYSRHIRILRVSWQIIIRVAGMVGHCTQLRVLLAHPVLMRDIPSGHIGYRPTRWVDVEKLAWLSDRAATAADWPVFWKHVEDEENRLDRFKQESKLKEPGWIDWNTSERFWILVLRNPLIEHLRLGRGLKTMHELVSPLLVYNVLASLPRLKSLDSRYLDLNLQTVLERTSTTHNGNVSNGIRFYHSHSGRESQLQLDRTFSYITFLSVETLIKSSSILMLLKRLPNLDQLCLNRITSSDDDGQSLFMDMDDNHEERTRPFVLSGLHLAFFAGLGDGFKPVHEAMARHLIPRMPSLTELTTEVLIPEMAKTVGEHCKQFRAYRQGNQIESINEDYTIDTELNAVSILLESCSNLETLNAIQHRITANYLLEHPWVCEKTLKTFRCQIVELNRLSPEECWSIASESKSERESANQSVMEEKYKRCLEQHRGVYERLSRLVHLQTLDLGSDIKGSAYHLFGDDGSEELSEVGGRLYLRHCEPIVDSLELSLASGLDRLGSLKNLQVFGFEGLNHCIEEPELDWIGMHWPSLRVMRGIHVDDSTMLAKKDTKTTALRGYMQQLRPFVRHEAAVSTNKLERYLRSTF